MIIPRWFLACLCVLAVNLVLVVASAWHKLALGDESGSLPATNARVGQEQPVTDEAAPPKLVVENAPPEAANLAKHIVGLPEFPSLEKPAPAEDDPLFREFLKMAEQYRSTSVFDEIPGSSESDLQMTSADTLSTREYFRTLDRRLETVGFLNSAARNIAREAAAASNRSDSAGSQKFLQMATEIRELAAELLVRGM